MQSGPTTMTAASFVASAVPVAHNSIPPERSFARNVDAKRRRLQFEQQMIAVRYTYARHATDPHVPAGRRRDRSNEDGGGSPIILVQRASRGKLQGVPPKARFVPDQIVERTNVQNVGRHVAMLDERLPGRGWHQCLSPQAPFIRPTS